MVKSKRKRKNVDAGIKSLEQKFSLWQDLNSFGKPRVQETKDQEVTILESIRELRQVVTELGGKVEETQSPEEIGLRRNFIAEAKTKLRNWEVAITTAQSYRKLNEDASETTYQISSPAPVVPPKVDEVSHMLHQPEIDIQNVSLGNIHNTVGNLKKMAILQGDEAKKQVELIEDLNEKAERERERLKAEDKFLSKLIRASHEKKSWVAIIILGILLFILVVVALSTP